MTLYVAAGACKSAIGKGLRYVRNPFSNLCEDYCRSIDTALEPIESQARHSVPAFCSCSTAQLWVLETVNCACTADQLNSGKTAKHSTLTSYSKQSQQ